MIRRPSTKKQHSRQRAAPQDNTPTYRRNRTMTDRSSLPEVSERAKAHHIRRLRRKIGVVLMVVTACFALGVAGALQYSGSVRVVSADSSLAHQFDDTAYIDLFATYYQQHPLERFRFLTSHDRLLAFLQYEAPEIELIKPAGMHSFGVSRYDIVVRRPVASWTVDDARYYVDADGVTFTKNYYAEPSVTVLDNSGAAVSRGSAIASSRLLSFVGRVVALSATHQVTISSIEIPTQSMRQIYVKGKGLPVIRMTIDREVDTQVNDMAVALRYLKKSKQAPSYVDVRVEGKAFYK